MTENTCCWTDHSNGCPWAEVDIRAYPVTHEGRIRWGRDYREARIRMGYTPDPLPTRWERVE